MWYDFLLYTVFVGCYMCCKASKIAQTISLDLHNTKMYSSCASTVRLFFVALHCIKIFAFYFPTFSAYVHICFQPLDWSFLFLFSFFSLLNSVCLCTVSSLGETNEKSQSRQLFSIQTDDIYNSKIILYMHNITIFRCYI